MKHPKNLSQKHMGIVMLGMMILFIAIYIVVWRTELKLADGGHMVLEVGEELSHDVEDYLNLTWYLPSEREDIIDDCQLTLDDIVYLDEHQQYPGIGKYQGMITYDHQTYPIDIQVVDETPPNIQCQETVAYGSQDFQVEDIIEVSDNSQDDCDVQIDGDVNVSKLGTYTLKVKAIDSSQNIAEKAFDVEVTDQMAPQIMIKPQIAYLHEEFDALENVQAMDDIDGDCTKDIQVSGEVNVQKAGTYYLTYTVQDQAGNQTKVKREVVVKEKETSYRIADVPMVLQLPDYRNGCESASLTMLLQYYGYDITLPKVIEKVPIIPLEYKDGRLYGADPHVAFTGSMSARGYGIYVEPMVDVLETIISEQKGNHQVKNLTGSSLDDLLTYVEMGHPIQIWATASLQTYEQSGKQEWYIKTLDGQYTDEKVIFPVSEHCMVLIGFDEEHVILNNPLQGITVWDKEAFETAYKDMGSQAIMIEE